MTLLESLLDAILRLDGDALVMHVGELPYVVTTSSSNSTFRGPLSWGHVELSSRPLTADAVLGMLGQMLTHEQTRQLYEVGAIEHEIAAPAPSVEQFIVTAARGGDDVWVEVRRKPKPPAQAVAEAAPADAAPAVAVEQSEAPVEPAAVSVPVAEVREEHASVEDSPIAATHAESEVDQGDAGISLDPVVSIDSEEEEFAYEIVGDDDADFGAVDKPIVGDDSREPAFASADEDVELTLDLGLLADGEGRSNELSLQDLPPSLSHLVDPASAQDIEPVSIVIPEPVDNSWSAAAASASEEETVAELVAAISREVLEDAVNEPVEMRPPAPPPPAPPPAAPPTLAEAPLAPAPPPPAPPPPPPSDEVPASVSAEPLAAPVVSIARPPLKLQPVPSAPPPTASTEASLVELLRTALARRASTVYVVTGSRPMIRVDSEITQLGTEPIVTSAEVERFALEFAPRDRVQDAPGEWTCDVPGVGHIRSVTFEDHSGAGLILHLPSTADRTVASLGLEPQVQALCEQSDGLILVAGPRSSGKSTLLSAFVDLINQTRNDHVVTIESEIRTIYEKRRSFISQREVHGDGDAIAAAARAALREKPDVLVIADLRAPEAITVALDAARAGRLVFGAIAAPTASAAVERLVDVFAVDRRPQVRALVAGALRAVVAQVLLERPGGGRVAARELLINSPAVGKLIVDGTMSQLPVAIEAGRRLGMRTMIDALGALVRDGNIDAAEACRRAPDRAALIVALRRDGVDVSDLERRA